MYVLDSGILTRRLEKKLMIGGCTSEQRSYSEELAEPDQRSSRA